MITHSPLQKIEDNKFKEFGINVFIKRDDLIHPVISGNKFRKLKYNLIEAKKKGLQGVLSLGGAYSNHIHALAYACQQESLKSIGIIRGETHYQDNATLSQARSWGMDLKFVDRATYRLRNTPEFTSQLRLEYPDYLFVPEGGTNKLALQGVAECIDEVYQENNIDYLITPVGSAGTLSGLIQGANKNTEVLGVATLKQSEYLLEEIESLISNSDTTKKNWRLLADYHDGGYGKFSQTNVEIITQFISQHQIPFEPIYSGKMLIAFLDLLTKGYFKHGSNVVLLHTGGLQGLKGLIERERIKADQWLLPSE